MPGPTSGLPKFTVQLYGLMECRIGTTPVIIKNRKAKWLLALLCLRNGKSLDRGWVASTLWPDAEQASARFYLRRTLGELKTALGDQSARIETAADLSLRFDLADAECDVTLFDNLIQQSSRAGAEQAVEHYSGPLLQECDDEWVHQERTIREQQYITALYALANAALSNGDFRRTAEYARRLIAVDPLQESAYRLLIEALFRYGSAAEATQTYRDLRVLLRNELNSDPDPATSALYQKYKLQSRAELVTGTNSQAEPPPAQQSVVLQRAIPHLSVKLLGREELCAEAINLLGATQVLTLTGMGGIGKTSMALEMLDRAAGNYRDGAVFVELARLADPAAVPQAVARALGIKDQRDEDFQVSIERAIGKQNYLLVLDNCEHLLSACSQLVSSLVQFCPNLTILSTSRQPLRIRGEKTLVVTPLSVPTEEVFSVKRYTGKLHLHDALEYPAIQLFVDRSQQVNPHFQANPLNLPHIIRICRQLDGNPLAIELAAARIRVMTPAQIEARLSDRFRLLVSGNRSDERRQQTLRALVDWSYALLEQDERHVFACLSLFTGSCTLEAIQAVCAASSSEGPDDEVAATPLFDEWQVLDIVHSLVDSSLVVVEEGSGTKRFTMHATIRAYATECFEALVGRTDIVNKYCVFYKELTLGSLQLPMEQSISVVDADYSNILHAIALCSLLPEGGTTCLELACALERFWHVRSHFRHAEHYFNLAISHPSAPVETELYFLNRIGLANIARLQNRFGVATEMYELLLLDLVDGKFPGMYVRAAGNYATMLEVTGQYTRAKEYCEQALAVCRQAQLVRSEPVVIVKLASALRKLKQFEAAISLFQEGILLAQTQNQIRFMFEAHMGLAYIYRTVGDFSRAKENLDIVLDHYISIDSKLGIAAVQSEFAQIAIEKRDIDSARGYLGDALLSFVDMDFNSGILGCLQIGVVLLHAMGRDTDGARLAGWCSQYRIENGLAGVEYLPEQVLLQVEDALGNNLFDRQRSAGTQMSLDQAIAMVLCE